MIKRIFRIYPLFIVAVVLEAVFAHFIHGIPFPTLATWVPRLALVGDFFGTLYALNGVEWTLRVEVVFYVFMAALKQFGVISSTAVLPAVFVSVTVLVGVLHPFPNVVEWSNGYLTIYSPFLLIGSTIYLIEHQLASRRNGLIAIVMMFITSLLLSGKIQPASNEANFATLALALFVMTWVMRSKLNGGSFVRLMSELTFAVYLFHNWLWEYIEQGFVSMDINVLPQKIQILIVLFLICYLAQRYIEKPCVNIGRGVVGFLKEKKKRPSFEQSVA